MVNQDVVTSKISHIKQHLQRVETVSRLSEAEFVSSQDSQDVAIFNLQVAIQTCIDLGNHIYSEMDIGVPGSYSEIFYTLADREIITRELSETMIQMVGLRNRIVHGYESLDVKKIYNILKHGLKDFNYYLEQISTHYL